jgi:hypothetical protein
LLLGFGELFFKVGNDAVSQLARTGILARTLRGFQLGAGLFDPFFDLLGAVDLGLFALPARCELRGFIFKLRKLTIQFAQTFTARRILFFLQGGLFDFKQDDPRSI